MWNNWLSTSYILVVLKDKSNFEHSKLKFEQIMILDKVYDLLVLVV
jgi:hypothetical protein